MDISSEWKTTGGPGGDKLDPQPPYTRSNTWLTEDEMRRCPTRVNNNNNNICLKSNIQTSSVRDIEQSQCWRRRRVMPPHVHTLQTSPPMFPVICWHYTRVLPCWWCLNWTELLKICSLMFSLSNSVFIILCLLFCVYYSVFIILCLLLCVYNSMFIIMCL